MTNTPKDVMTHAAEAQESPIATVLIAEGDYFMAGNLVEDLKTGGYHVRGPVRSSVEVRRLLSDHAGVDMALVDLGLGEEARTIADLLAEMNIPFIFASEGAKVVVPDDFRDMPCLLKPIDPQRFRTLFRAVVDGGAR